MIKFIFMLALVAFIPFQTHSEEISKDKLYTVTVMLQPSNSAYKGNSVVYVNQNQTEFGRVFINKKGVVVMRLPNVGRQVY